MAKIEKKQTQQQCWSLYSVHIVRYGNKQISKSYGVGYDSGGSQLRLYSARLVLKA